MLAALAAVAVLTLFVVGETVATALVGEPNLIGEPVGVKAVG